MSSPTLPRHRLRSRRPLTTPDPLPQPGRPAGGLADAERAAALELEVAQLRTAMASRAGIEQAKGILMQRRNASAEEAFDVLRRASQDLNVKLRDVAAWLVEQTRDGATAD